MLVHLINHSAENLGGAQKYSSSSTMTMKNTPKSSHLIISKTNQDNVAQTTYMLPSLFFPT